MKILDGNKNFAYKQIKKKFFNKKSRKEVSNPDNTEEMNEYIEYYKLATRWK